MFNYVAKTVKYDHGEADERIAYTISQNNGTCKDDPLNNKYTFKTPLDDILDSKAGVCEHYARLMAGMLRSLGIPCKVCSGDMYDGKVIPGYNDDKPGWISHAWVAVKPETGTLDMKALGAGKDFKPAELGEVVNSVPTGWIRLDPTNAHIPNVTANDKNYITNDCY